MKLQIYTGLFLIVLGLISGCRNNESTPEQKKAPTAADTKSAVSPSAQDYNNRGTTYQRTGRLQEAAAAYHRAIQMKPTLIQAHHNLGTVYVMQGKLTEAAWLPISVLFSYALTWRRLMWI